MGSAHDLTGRVFGRLRAIRKSNKRSKGGVVWVCGCACGNTTLTSSTSLTSGNTQSCGCMMRGRAVTSIAPGSRFGKLFVIARAPKPNGLKGAATFWRVACDCGSSPFTVRSDSLRQGRTTRCIRCAHMGSHKRNGNNKLGLHDGKTVREWADHYGLTPAGIHSRLFKHGSVHPLGKGSR